MKLKQVPSFLEFLSYINCVPSCLMGPYNEYTIHKNWIEKRGNY